MKRNSLTAINVIVFSIALLYVYSYFTIAIDEQDRVFFYFKVFVSFIVLHVYLMFFLLTRKSWIEMRTEYPEEFRSYFGIIHPGYIFILLSLFLDLNYDNFPIDSQISGDSGFALIGFFWILGTEFYRAIKIIKVLYLKMSNFDDKSK